MRARLIDAFTKRAAEVGYERVDAADVAAVAGLPSEAFAVCFADKRQCLIAAFDRFVDQLIAEIVEALDPEAPWSLQVRSGVAATIAFIAERVEVARLFAVEATAGGPAMAERHEVAMRRIDALLRCGRERSAGAAALPPLVEPVLVAGAANLVTAALLSEDRDRLRQLEFGLVEVLELPYAAAAARRPAAA